MDQTEVIKALAALAQPVRLQVFRELVVAGAEGLTPSAKELFHADLVSQERQGRNVLYRAAFPVMNELLAYLTENCCQGAACSLQQPKNVCAC